MYEPVWQTNKETIALYQVFPGPFLNQLQKKYAKEHELRNADIFHEYFYKGNTTYADMGKKHNISPERVRQILMQGLRIIRGSWRSAMAVKQYPEVAAFQEKYGTGKKAFDELLRRATKHRPFTMPEKKGGGHKMSQRRTTDDLVKIWTLRNGGMKFDDIATELKMGQHYPNKVYNWLRLALAGKLTLTANYAEAVERIKSMQETILANKTKLKENPPIEEKYSEKIQEENAELYHEKAQELGLEPVPTPEDIQQEKVMRVVDTLLEEVIALAKMKTERLFLEEKVKLNTKIIELEEEVDRLKRSRSIVERLKQF